MQTSKPIAPDIAEGQWTPTPIFSRINQPQPNDATAVTSSDNPKGDYFEVPLGPVAWPQAGPQTLNVRLNSSAAGLGANIVLLQGTQQIASWNVQPTSSFTTMPFVLNQQQIDSITDYTNLRLKVVALRGTQTFTSSGTWTCPPGITSVQLEMWGSGGPGGAFGTAGGGGGYSKYYSVAVTPGNVYDIQVNQGTTTGGGGGPNLNSLFSYAGTTLAIAGGGGPGNDVLNESGGPGFGYGDVPFNGGYNVPIYPASGTGGGGSAGPTSDGNNTSGDVGAPAVPGGGAGGNYNGGGGFPGGGGGGGGYPGPYGTSGGGMIILTW